MLLARAKPRLPPASMTCTAGHRSRSIARRAVGRRVVDDRDRRRKRRGVADKRLAGRRRARRGVVGDDDDGEAGSSGHRPASSMRAQRARRPSRPSRSAPAPRRRAAARPARAAGVGQQLDDRIGQRVRDRAGRRARSAPRRRRSRGRPACRARPAARRRPALRAASGRSLRTPTGTRTPARVAYRSRQRRLVHVRAKRDATRAIAGGQRAARRRDPACGCARVLADDLEPRARHASATDSTKAAIERDPRAAVEDRADVQHDRIARSRTAGAARSSARSRMPERNHAHRCAGTPMCRTISSRENSESVSTIRARRADHAVSAAPAHAFAPARTIPGARRTTRRESSATSGHGAERRSVARGEEHVGPVGAPARARSVHCSQRVPPPPRHDARRVP